MLKYLIIPLTSDAVSFCHYPSQHKACEEISEDVLREAIVWAMKNNVSVQFVYPVRPVPRNLAKIVDIIDHASIVPFNHSDGEMLKKADIIVFDRLTNLPEYAFMSKKSYAVKASFSELKGASDIISQTLHKVDRLNIIFEDLSEINMIGIDEYQSFLENLIPIIVEEYKKGHQVQFNLLTDRLMLKEMNNCNAGDESITLAPDAKFYLCPAFYIDGEHAVGDLIHGISILNSQLLKLSHAPICRICDAYQCKRCVWLNRTLTREINTPSREQCVIAHIERNSSKKLLEAFRKINPTFLAEAAIPEIDYIDPFDKLKNN